MIAEATLDQDIVAEGFYSVEKLIADTAHRFNRTFGGDLEEQLSQAVFLFVNGHHRYEESKARTYSSWIRFFVWKNLLEGRRTELNRARLLPRVEYDLEKHESSFLPSAFRLFEFVESLKGDAATIVRLVFERPPQLKKDLSREGEETPARVRTCLRRYLMAVGWTAARVRDAFQEVSHALKD